MGGVDGFDEREFLRVDVGEFHPFEGKGSRSESRLLQSSLGFLHLLLLVDWILFRDVLAVDDSLPIRCSESTLANRTKIRRRSPQLDTRLAEQMSARCENT